MTDIVNLRPMTAEPDPDVVETLENALEMARSGQLRSITLVGQVTGHATYVAHATHDIQAEIGAVSFLLHTLCARQRETPSDPAS